MKAASTPRRQTKTRKAPVESHSPTKGGARKKKSTLKSKSKTNVESQGSSSNGSVASLASSGDADSDIEVMSTTSIASMNSDDKLYNTFLMELAEGEELLYYCNGNVAKMLNWKMRLNFKWKWELFKILIVKI